MLSLIARSISSWLTPRTLRVPAPLFASFCPSLRLLLLGLAGQTSPPLVAGALLVLLSDGPVLRPLSVSGLHPLSTCTAGSSSMAAARGARSRIGRGAVPLPVTQGCCKAPTTSSRLVGSCKSPAKNKASKDIVGIMSVCDSGMDSCWQAGTAL
jgi:hypothetical protein